VTVSSGLPLNLTVNGTPSNTGSVAVDRPNVVGDWQLADPAVQQWFNTGGIRRQREVHLRQRGPQRAALAGTLQSRPGGRTRRFGSPNA